MDESKKGYLSMSQGIHFSKKISPKTLEEREKIAMISYASVVESIMYAMLYSRPNVAYTLGIVSRF